MERHDTVGGEVEGSGAGTRVQMGLQQHQYRQQEHAPGIHAQQVVHEFLARVLVANVDAVAAVFFGVKLARIDLDNGEVQGVLTGFGGEDD